MRNGTRHLRGPLGHLLTELLGPLADILANLGRIVRQIMTQLTRPVRQIVVEMSAAMREITRDLRSSRLPYLPAGLEPGPPSMPCARPSRWTCPHVRRPLCPVRQDRVRARRPAMPAARPAYEPARSPTAEASAL